MAKQQNRLTCSFCGKSRDEVNVLIAGQQGEHICDNCVEHAQELIGQEMNYRDKGKTKNYEFSIRKPAEIKSFLDKYIVGQTDAKKNHQRCRL